MLEQLFDTDREGRYFKRFLLEGERVPLIPRLFLDGILLTCIFMSASPVHFHAERHDVESDQPAFLEPADTAAIDRGLFLRSVTKGPKCGHSLFLLSLAHARIFSLFLLLVFYLFLSRSLVLPILTVGVPSSFEYQTDALDLSKDAKSDYE